MTANIKQHKNYYVLFINGKLVNLKFKSSYKAMSYFYDVFYNLKSIPVKL